VVYFNVPEAEYLNYKIKARKDSVMTVKLLMANNSYLNTAESFKPLKRTLTTKQETLRSGQHFQPEGTFAAW